MGVTHVIGWYNDIWITDWDMWAGALGPLTWKPLEVTAHRDEKDTFKMCD